MLSSAVAFILDGSNSTHLRIAKIDVGAVGIDLSSLPRQNKPASATRTLCELMKESGVIVFDESVVDGDDV